MMVPRRRSWLGLFLLIAILGIVGAGWWFRPSPAPTVEADILLQQVRDVSQLVTNQGEFLEIYSYKDYWGYDIVPFRKQALVRAKARASVGFDLEKIGLEVREEARIIILDRLPEPEILSLEVEVDYYDLTDGTFNDFSAEDLNQIEKDVRMKMRQKVLQSDLFRRADQRIRIYTESLRHLADQTGMVVSLPGSIPPQGSPMNDYLQIWLTLS